MGEKSGAATKVVEQRLEVLNKRLLNRVGVKEVCVCGRPVHKTTNKRDSLKLAAISYRRGSVEMLIRLLFGLSSHVSLFDFFFILFFSYILY